MTTKNKGERRGEMFGYGKDDKYVSFPYDWIKPGEFRCEPNGSWKPEIMVEMVKLGTHRRDVEMLEPIFWMKP